MQRIKNDVVVVGSGVAGLSFAIQLAKKKPQAKIAVVSKTELTYSNSHFAQGGIATVTNTVNDSFDEHFNDTIASGGGLSNPAIVKLVIEKAPHRLNELMDYGMNFTLTKEGDFDLGLEGGHSKPRVVHALDNTGEHLINILIKKAQSFSNITFYTHRLCIDIIKNKVGNAVGISALNINQQKIECFVSKFVVLATGGSGQVYKNTTNPSVATGDGIALGIEAGAMLSNLNFVQFHPTVLFEENKEQLDLLSEAIRGYGAYVVDKKECRFLFKYDARGELATRDIVSNAIFSKLNQSGEKCVYLDCRHLETTKFKKNFPKITSNLTNKSIDVSTDLIPIVPAAHYQCGGLKVNEKGQTNIFGLYAIGECAETGLHGANRLASNSLLEGLVFAYEAAEFISFMFDDVPYTDAPIHKTVYKINYEKDELLLKIKAEIKETMMKGATIMSDMESLILTKKSLEKITKTLVDQKETYSISPIGVETYNLCLVACEIVRSKIEHLNQKEHCAKQVEEIV